MYEATVIFALALLVGLGAYLIVKSASEAAPPEGRGRRDLICAAEAAAAAALLLGVAAYIVKTTTCRNSRAPLPSEQCTPPNVRPHKN